MMKEKEREEEKKEIKEKEEEGAKKKRNEKEGDVRTKRS